MTSKGYVHVPRAKAYVPEKGQWLARPGAWAYVPEVNILGCQRVCIPRVPKVAHTHWPPEVVSCAELARVRGCVGD